MLKSRFFTWVGAASLFAAMASAQENKVAFSQYMSAYRSIVGALNPPDVPGPKSDPGSMHFSRNGTVVRTHEGKPVGPEIPYSLNLVAAVPAGQAERIRIFSENGAAWLSLDRAQDTLKGRGNFSIETFRFMVTVGDEKLPVVFQRNRFESKTTYFPRYYLFLLEEWERVDAKPKYEDTADARNAFALTIVGSLNYVASVKHSGLTAEALIPAEKLADDRTLTEDTLKALREALLNAHEKIADAARHSSKTVR